MGVMTTNITVTQLAEEYATLQLRNRVDLQHPQRGIVHRRITYDTMVTAFNGATVAMIALIAITVITSSITWFLLLSASYLVRSKVLEAIDMKGFKIPQNIEVVVNPYFMMRVLNIATEDQKRDQVLNHLDIPRENPWQPNQYNILGFIVWKNWTPEVGVQAQPMDHLEE